VKRKLATLLFWSLSFTTYAAESTSTQTEIPYFIYELKEISSSAATTKPNISPSDPSTTIVTYRPMMQTTASASGSESSSKNTYYVIIDSIKQLASNAVSTAIKQIRTTICDAAGDADAKVWVYFGADGKVGVGASAGAEAQSGIEIVFHCKKK
jgi:hypothetical protein